MNTSKPHSHRFFALLAAFACCSLLYGEVTLDTGAKGVEKAQVTDSMIGFRDTLLFYAFGEEKAVLVVRIGNKDTSFPVSGKLHLFPEGTNAGGLAKWINNQHSDGLFPDVPEPKASHEIPAASCKAKAHEVVKQDEAPNGKFARYSVTFEIKDVPEFGDVKLKDFTDKATVNVKVTEA